MSSLHSASDSLCQLCTRERPMRSWPRKSSFPALQTAQGASVVHYGLPRSHARISCSPRNRALCAPLAACRGEYRTPCNVSSALRGSHLGPPVQPRGRHISLPDGATSRLSTRVAATDGEASKHASSTQSDAEPVDGASADRKGSGSSTAVEDYPLVQIPSAAPSGLPNGEQEGHEVATDVDAILPAWQKRWQVPWGGKETALGMVAWTGSFIGSALVVQIVAYKLGWTPWRDGNLDQKSLFLLVNQLVRTLMGIGIVWAVARPHWPLEPDFFRFDVDRPWNWERGWLLWACIGFVSACVVVQLAAMAQLTLEGGVEPLREEADGLRQVMPLIAASPLSTACLVAVVGICAPVLEETVFRGFLMASLTKWMPVPWAALFSACAFALAHLTPSEFPKLTALGIVLGLSYAKTRNLWTPMIMHSLWNSGIILFLTLLRLEGYNIDELI